MRNVQSFRLRTSEWESFAKKDPCHYICTELPRKDGNAFWQSGADTVEREIWPLVAKFRLQRQIAVEFGCGLGRLVFPVASYFQTVVGLDIAPSMVSKATSIALERGIGNASFVTIGQPDRVLDHLGQYVRKVDLVYSLLVFQHIDDFEVISSYLNAIRHLLTPAGIAYLQFDTRPNTMFYRIKTLLPDPFLMPQWKRGIRRIRRDTAQLESCFERNSLTILEKVAIGTEHSRYILRRRQ